MKIKKLIMAFALVLFASTFMAQENTNTKKKSKISKATFTVNGVCGMCQDRIENAALIKGVRMADWDKQAQTITVMFNNTKTTVETIAQAIADIGHDTEITKATDEAYGNLSACCAYRDGIEIH